MSDHVFDSKRSPAPTESNISHLLTDFISGVGEGIARPVADLSDWKKHSDNNKAPEKASIAYQVGSFAGEAADFIALTALSKRVIANPFAAGAIAGGSMGFLTPGQDHSVSGRLKSGAIGASTMAVLEGSGTLLARMGLEGNLAKVASNGVVSGLIAGAADVQLRSAVYQQKSASLSDTAYGAIGWGISGGIFSMAGAGIGKLGESIGRKAAPEVSAAPVVRTNSPPTDSFPKTIPLAADVAAPNHAIVETRSASEPEPRTEALGVYETQQFNALDTGYSLVGKIEGGTRGAYLVRDSDGVNHIFKTVSLDDLTPQIKRSAQAAAAVDSAGTRAPNYEKIGFAPGQGSWYVQELLGGKQAPNPSNKLISQLVTLNDRQAGAGVAGSENWSEKVLSVVHNDPTGFGFRIGNSSAEGAAFVARLQSFIPQKGSFVPRVDDIVHGDFQHYNALVSPTDRLTGYVDWEGAGHGDRAIDLSRLLYDAYVSEADIGYRPNPETLNMLADKIRSISGPAALNTYMSYWIMQVTEFGAMFGPETARRYMDVGRRIMDDLGSQQGHAAA